MQTSNHQDYLDVPADTLEQQHSAPFSRVEHVQGVLFISIILISFAVFGLWIMQNSVNAYYQQTYHQESPLVALDEWAVWHVGGNIGDDLYDQYAQIEHYVEQFNQNIIGYFNQNYAYTAEYKAALAEKERKEKQRLLLEAKLQAEHRALVDQFTLTKSKQVFFAGDSMMVGVAPHIQQFLQEKYEIKTVNLSKQSTGLAYPKLFNWPETIRMTLQNNPAIKVMVVFLGPNDPWDMQSSTSHKYLTFKTPEWEADYRSRIRTVIDTAQKYHVSVMWISPPNMRKDSLNEQMAYLNQVVADEVKKDKAFFIDSRQILGTSNNNKYSDYLIQNGHSIKTRSADGIHFSVEGQKLIASTIIKHLHVIND